MDEQTRLEVLRLAVEGAKSAWVRAPIRKDLLDRDRPGYVSAGGKDKVDQVDKFTLVVEQHFEHYCALIQGSSSPAHQVGLEGQTGEPVPDDGKGAGPSGDKGGPE